MEIPTSKAVEHFFPDATFVQVYFEAVANALDAQAPDAQVAEVTICIATQPLRITIKDNGEGFTNDRYARFCRLLDPKDRDHKGLGRLVYLKWFSRVDVESVFADKRRTFTFSNAHNGPGNMTVVDAGPSHRRGTTLSFSGFEKRTPNKEDIGPETLKVKILEHFLPRLYKMKENGSRFSIYIELDDSRTRAMVSNSASLTDSDVPKFDCIVIKDAYPQIDAINDTDIKMMYAILPGSGQALTAACIDGRTIPINLISNPAAIPSDRSATFLFESELFAGRADSARQHLVYKAPLTEETLFPVLRREVSRVLADKIPDIKITNDSVRDTLEKTYPHFAGLFDNEPVGLINREQALDAAQRRFFRKQRDVLESASPGDDETFEKSVDVASRALTEYILYRDFTIKRLRAISPEDHESVAHSLIAPMRKRYDGENVANDIYRHNAWLLDDRFMTYRHTLSDFTMREVITEIVKDDPTADPAPNDLTRPDISLIFSADPATVDRFDVVIVEFKRRGKNERDSSYVTRQLTQRSMRLARYWPNIQRAWYFAVIDIDQELADTMETEGWTPLYSKGQLFYRELNPKRRDGSRVPTPAYVLSYDTIIEDAEARNHTFLELLKSEFRSGRSTP